MHALDQSENCSPNVFLQGKAVYPCATLMLKATYTLPTAGQVPAVAQQQMPWFYADEPLDETGTGAPAHEADLPYEKPHAEFLVVGNAHAPRGQPIARFPFGVAVGQTTKRMNAVGARTWRKGPTGAMYAGAEPNW